jgi:hypothetical protein
MKTRKKLLLATFALLVLLAVAGCGCCDPAKETCEPGEDICTPTPDNPQHGTTLHNQTLTLDQIRKINEGRNDKGDARPNFPAPAVP